MDSLVLDAFDLLAGAIGDFDFWVGRRTGLMVGVHSAVPKVYCTVHAIKFKLRHAGATPLTGVQPHPMIVVGLSLDFFAIHDRNSSGFD